MRFEEKDMKQGLFPVCILGDKIVGTIIMDNTPNNVDLFNYAMDLMRCLVEERGDAVS